MRIQPAVGTLAALLVVIAGCSSGGDSRPQPGTSTKSSGAAAGKSRHSTGATSAKTSASAAKKLQIRCLDITTAQAAQILDIPGPYSVSGDARYPCPAFWTSPTKWEQGKGPDSLHGKPSDASISVFYIDFPNSAAAHKEYSALHTASVKQQIDKFGTKRSRVSPVNTDGDAEAYLAVPEPRFLNVENSAGLSFTLAGRCGARLLRLDALKDLFYSSVMAGHSPSEQNIVRRGRTPIPAEKSLRAAYSLLGVPLCAGEDLPSIMVGPYRPLSKP